MRLIIRILYAYNIYNAFALLGTFTFEVLQIVNNLHSTPQNENMPSHFSDDEILCNMILL
jgi:hypothetical protein